MGSRKTQINIGILIFLCFLLTGSAYITWLYNLAELFGSFSADWLSEGVGYMFQAAGIFLLALLVKHNSALVRRRGFLTAVLLADGAMMAAAILADTRAAALIFGLIMNIGHGVVAGIYLTKLAAYVPQQRRGAVFGFAYALGSIGSWLLSLPLDKQLLRSRYSLFIYLVLIALILILNYTGGKEELPDSVGNSPSFRVPGFALIAAVIFLFSLVKGLSFYFPMSESVGGAINLEFSRSFYAIGLIAAGLIGDYNRKYGAVCCLAALVFPFLSFALNGVPGAPAALWILGYIFFGFISIYRVLVFCDIAAKKNGLLWMAGFGLLFGRLGDAAGAVSGITQSQNKIFLIVLSSLLFVLTIMLFFALYHKLYVPILTNEQAEEKMMSSFEARCGLSARECEVFRLLVKGRSNTEIAGDLYISDNTVKFHVKNVLKKAGCCNRTALSVKYKSME